MSTIKKLNAVASKMGFFGAEFIVEDEIVIMNISGKRYYLGLIKCGSKYLIEALDKIG
jgi:hypothetical protein